MKFKEYPIKPFFTLEITWKGKIGTLVVEKDC
jgi:hypothetical protein